MINPDVIQKMERPQLMELAGKLDIKIHHKSKDETVRRQIIEQYASRQMNSNPVQKEGWEEPKPKDAKPVFNNTEADVLEALGALKDKDGFKVTFPGDNTVIFTYRGLSESCNLSIPMHVIMRQAKSAASIKYGPAMTKDAEYQGKVGVMMFG